MPYLFDNCQGRWKLGNTTWTDGSGNGYTLTASASAPTAVAGHGGGNNQAANFNSASTQYLYIADASAPSLDITGNITISAWIKATTITGGIYYHIIAKLGATSFSYDLYIDNNGKLEGRISSDGSTVTAAIGAATLVAGTWYHVAAVYNGTDIRLYINGVLDSNGANNPKACTGSIYSGSSDFCIGIKSDKAANPFNGVIDDAAVWDRALSASEVSTLYGLFDDFAMAGALSGTIKDKNGAVVNCSTYNVRVNVYQKNNSTAAPLKTLLVTSANGTWSISGLLWGQKYAVSFEYEGSYTPTAENDIAAQEFLTAA